MSVDHKRLMAAAREVLQAIGEDPNRVGLRETPRRFADAWTEFVDFDPGKLETHFETIQTDQMVIVSGMETWSLCEHHLMPFRVTVAIGYVPDERLLGLSKFGRVVERAAHKLQLQERLTQEIACQIEELADTPNVAVFAQGLHLCMAMRGVRMAATMTSSVMLGLFLEKPAARAEFLALARGSM